jgi:uncharacterized protein YfaS (alpha-2-macroglobulin family)
MPFASQGFSVGREYFNMAGAPVTQAQVGDLVQVKITLITPTELHDVVVEDPLPAGLEALDTRLKTTSEAVKSAVKAAQKPAWQPWAQVDVRADKIALFATLLPRGAHQYTYLARAALAGEYRVLPTNGREQYFPEVFARADGRRFVVVP